MIAWCADTRLDHSLTLRLLRQALRLRAPAPGLIDHSDRGAQYAATAYRELLTVHGAVSSTSRRGNCWDNAVAESFFATLTTELVHRVLWPTRSAATQDDSLLGTTINVVMPPSATAVPLTTNARWLES